MIVAAHADSAAPAPAVSPAAPLRKVAFNSAKAMMEKYSLDELMPAASRTNDDVKVDGASVCAALFAEKCASAGVAAGTGKAATCLREHTTGKQANVGSAGAKACRVEVNKFFSSVRKDITTYNEALATACKAELSSDGGGVCAEARTPASFYSPNKKKATGRIDPAVAAIMAVGRAEVGLEKRKARDVLIV